VSVRGVPSVFVVGGSQDNVTCAEKASCKNHGNSTSIVQKREAINSIGAFATLTNLEREICGIMGTSI
jgi:hypothetical protein